MMDLLFTTKTKLYRAVTRGGRNETTWEPVNDDHGTQVELLGRLETTRRRVRGADGAEILTDGRYMCRAGEGDALLRAEDVLVTEQGDAFRIVTLDGAELPFTTNTYQVAALAKTRQPVPTE